MKVGDRLKCIDPAYVDFLSQSTTLTVSKIFDKDDDTYLIHIAEFGDFLFPESSFQVIPEGVEQHLELNFRDPVTPKQHVMAELNKWRDRLIDAENNEDPRDVQRCGKFIDFFLDKLLEVQKFEKATEGTGDKTPMLAD